MLKTLRVVDPVKSGETFAMVLEDVFLTNLARYSQEESQLGV